MSRGLYPLGASGELLERVTGRRDQTLARADRPGDLGNVEVAVRVERQTVRCAEVPGATRIGGAPGFVDRTIIAEPCQDRAAVVEDRDAARTVARDRSGAERPETFAPRQLGDDGDAARIEYELRRPLHLGPLSEELTVGTEDLDPIVLAIAHEDAAIRVDRDAVRDHELAGTAAGLTPRPAELALRREVMHARVPVAIRDVEVTAGRDGETRRSVERRSAVRDRCDGLPVVAGVGGAAARAEGLEEATVAREAPHRLITVVGAPERLVRRDGDPVSARREHALAPRANEGTVALVDEHGVVATAEEVHATGRIDGDVGHVGVVVSRRELLPASDDLEGGDRGRGHPRQG